MYQHAVEMNKGHRFEFGANWMRFLKVLNDDRINEAKKSMTGFMKLKDLKGKTFIDIGCGSGLFSYAAYLLKAKEITSIDIDPFSVKCAEPLHKKAKSPKNWKIAQASILDKKYISALGQYDIVYSWGVLHHTGRMYESIKIASGLVKKDGLFYITIYNRSERIFGSRFWLKIKRIYNSSPQTGKIILETLLMTKYILVDIVRLRNPITQIKDYKKKRGMSWRRDIADWLGGYPYESANVEEIFKFIKKEQPRLQLINIKTVESLACNWYLFKKT